MPKFRITFAHEVVTTRLAHMDVEEENLDLAEAIAQDIAENRERQHVLEWGERRTRESVDIASIIPTSLT